MIKYNHIFATSIVALCGVVGCNARAAQNAPMVMSKYGEIQSVNKYSSNPFWTPNSPYNQRFPTPIYVTGPDLTSGDCNRIVQNLVSEYCTNRSNCSNLRIADVRPIVMVQLSQLPGHNFATSCGGYIDSVFENYKKSYGNVSTNNIVKPAQQNVATIQIENPFKQTKSEYEIGVAERAAELESLQKQTTPNAELSATAFPKTIDDLSFTDRVANTTAGYEPYKNLNAYKTPKFETEDEYYERMRELLEHDITYIGADAGGCPSKYLTGRGATVSCAPTRQHGTCSAWCIDAALTDCKTSFTISPNDRDDKTFYGKCTCDTSAGYEMDGYKCVKPGTPVDPEDPVDPVDPNSNNCPDPNSNNCDRTPSGAAIPQCLIKMSKDRNFNILMSNKLNTSTNINLQELQNKQILSDIAQNVYNFCIDSDTAPAADFAEFNAFLDTENPIPVSITINNQTTTVDINAEELFNYTDYSFDVIAIQKTIFQLQSTIKRNDVTYLPKRKTCALYYGPAPVTDCISVTMFGKTPSITSAAKEVYGDHIYNINESPVWAFPGNLVYGKNGSCQGTIVRMRNYKIARQKIKALAANLKSASGCSGLGMTLYLVNPKSASLNNNKITEAIIKSEPFFIP